jgi:hypothetical protein
MISWTIGEAKRDFKAGSLCRAVVLFPGGSPNYGDFTVNFVSSLGASGPLIDGRGHDREPRVFKSLSSAQAAVRRVGFKKMEHDLRLWLPSNVPIATPLHMEPMPHRPARQKGSPEA